MKLRLFSVVVCSPYLKIAPIFTKRRNTDGSHSDGRGAAVRTGALRLERSRVLCVEWHVLTASGWLVPRHSASSHTFSRRAHYSDWQMGIVLSVSANADDCLCAEDPASSPWDTFQRCCDHECRRTKVISDPLDLRQVFLGQCLTLLSPRGPVGSFSD